MTDILVKNARVIDGTQDRPSDAIDIRLVDGYVQEVSASLSAPDTATVIDAKSNFVMPGLIDAHVHVNAQNANLKENAALPDAIATVGAMNLMQAMLARGFTTVRDLGGASGPLRKAMEMAPVQLPRLNICGKALSQTGGHTDQRGPLDDRPVPAWPVSVGAMGVICDGVPELRKA
ncbi:MAG: amidohydrolase family protein, partial [Candidatus Puniceispirillum sp.]